MLLKFAIGFTLSLFMSTQVVAMLPDADDLKTPSRSSPSITDEQLVAKECNFCKIGQGKEKAHVFWESDTHMAFLNVNPRVKGSAFVIPKAHQDSYFVNVPEEDLAKFMIAAQTVSKILDEKLHANRTALMITGLSVPHLHARLSPVHHVGDTKYIVSNERGEKASDEELAKMARLLRGESDDSAETLKEKTAL